MFAEIFGLDGVVVLVVAVVVLFGGTQIPKLARSLGSAQREFKTAQRESSSTMPVTVDETSVEHTNS